MPVTRRMRLPARPSRTALMTGMPPATAASKASTAPPASAAPASSAPCSASSALLAVTTWRPARKDASTRERAGLPVPPISSATTSTAGSDARPSGFSCQAYAARSVPRLRERSRALTAVPTLGRAARAGMTSAFSRSSRSTPAPTVPSPAIPTRRGFAAGVWPAWFNAPMPAPGWGPRCCRPAKRRGCCGWPGAGAAGSRRGRCARGRRRARRSLSPGPRRPARG